MPITLDIFKDHFATVCGAHDRQPKPNTIEAWYKDMAEWDYNTFAAVMDRLKYLENFPKLRDAIAIKRVVAGDPNPKKQEEGLAGCKWCDGGRIFYHKVDGDGAIASQGFVGRCSLCALPQLARYRDVHPEMLYRATGWDFDMSHKERWAMLKAGKDPDEPWGVGSAQLAAVAPFGKADPVTEKARSRELWKEQQREEANEEA